MLSQAKRAYFDIVAHVLTILSVEPHTKTRLSGKAKLDSRGIQRYMRLLMKAKLIEVDDNSLLRITPKGKDFLIQYEKLKLFLED